MDEQLAEFFEAQRGRLRGLAYRMLGSSSEADDAVQEAWLRLSRADLAGVADLEAWLRTVVSRLCLDMLRTRRSRREEPLEWHAPAEDDGPEREAMMVDAVGRALLVVLDTLGPAERVAFVLHDLFAVPFDEIAPILGRSPVAARQLASRARRRVQGAAPAPDPDRTRQREVVDAFFAAARDGNVDALVAVLDPDVVLRSDGGTARARQTVAIHGARAVAAQAVAYTRLAPFVRPALINGAAGGVVAAGGQALSVMGFTVAHGKIVAIDVLADPERLAGLDLAALADAP
jgi:RNA polymerase sigma factor (sigma-70 family)